MLLRMYLRWAERQGFETVLYDYQPGEEAGLKSATFAVNGEYAFGLLTSEIGVHRLVRLSPFDSAHRRHTSFAGVEVAPVVAETTDVVLLEALRRRRRVWEVDTTGRSVADVAREVDAIVRDRAGPHHGSVDWLADPLVTDYLLPALR